jgi:hypothetical protein
LGSALDVHGPLPATLATCLRMTSHPFIPTPPTPGHNDRNFGRPLGFAFCTNVCHIPTMRRHASLPALLLVLPLLAIHAQDLPSAVGPLRPRQYISTGGGTGATNRLAIPRAESSTLTNELSLTWRKDPDSVDARIIRQPLSKVLPHIAKASGWQVFTEPGTDSLISSAFRNQPAREAIGRILSNFSYAIVPGTNNRPRLLVFRTSSGSATEEVDPSDALRVDEEVVVRLKDGSRLTAEELAKLTGGEVAGKLEGLNAARIRYPDAAAADAAREKLAGIDGVSVEDNHRLPNQDSAGLLEGLAASAGLGIRPAAVSTGKLVIGLIDSAVQPINPAYDAFLVGRESVVATKSTSSELSHGTSMFANIVKAAETTAGQGGTAAFGVLAVDVYGANESTTAFDVAMGIQRAIERGANVINLSLSSTVHSPFLHGTIQMYNERGVQFLAAAGNDPIITPTFPASYPEVLAVTAGNSSGQFAPYANRGPFVDLMLPGSGIVPYGGDRWLVTGTSTATAYASGIAGALWNPSIGSPSNLTPLLLQKFGVSKP